MRGNRAIFGLVLVISVNSGYGAIIFHDPTLYEGSACQTADNRSGICSFECSTLSVSQLRNKANICGFKKRDVILCCPKVLFDESVKYPTIEQACIDSQQRKEERIRTSEEVKRRIQSEEKEYAAFGKEYLGIVPAKNAKNIRDCEEEAKKIGGKGKQSYVKWCKSLFIRSVAISSTSLYLDYPNKFPHMAAIGRYQFDDGATISWDCSGTLIHRSFVVTSASCIFGRGTPQIVRLGSINLLDDKRGAYDVDYAIEKIFVHAQHQPGEHKYNIALLKINRIVDDKKGSYVPPLPACVWMQPDYPSEKVVMMGYNASGFEEEYTTRLYQKSFTSTGKCLDFYNLDQLYLSRMSSKEVCAVNPENEADHCMNNFGVPLLLNGENERATPYVVGVSSANPLCSERKPEMVTNLHDNLDWIEEVMSKHQ